MEIDTQIRTIMAYKNLAQKDVAECLNMSPASFSRKINAKTFSVSDLQKIAEALGFDLEITFTDRETGKKL